MSSDRRFITSLTAVPDPGSCAADVEWRGERVNAMLIKHAGKLSCYLNRCPHTGAPLDWVPGKFLDISGQYIQCALHGALFRTEDGYCISGPCVNSHLQAVPIEVIDDRVYLQPSKA